MVILDREEFQRWRDSPLTQQFLTLLKQRSQEMGAAWARGRQLSPEQQAAAVLLGQLAGISFDHDPEKGRFGIYEMFELERPEVTS